MTFRALPLPYRAYPLAPRRTWRALALAAMSFAMAACDGGDADSRPLTRSELLGEWAFESSRVDVAAVSSEPGAPRIRIEAFEILTDEADAMWTFRGDGTYAVAGAARHRWFDRSPTAGQDFDELLFDELIDLDEAGTFRLADGRLSIVPADSTGISSRIGGAVTYEVVYFDGVRLELYAEPADLDDYTVFPEDHFESTLVLTR